MWDQTTHLTAQTIVLTITAGILVWSSWEMRQSRKIQRWPLVIVQKLDPHHIILTRLWPF